MFGLWCLTSLSIMFQLYIVAVSFIGGGNRSTWWKPPTCHKLLTNSSHNVVLSTPRHEQGSNSQFKWWWALIAQVVVNPTTIRSRVRQPQHVLNSPCNFLTMWYNSHVLYGSLSLQTYLYFHKVSYCWNHMIHFHGMQVRSGMPESIINYTHLFHNKIKRRSQLNSFIKMG